jgi:hypothetical protein
MLQPATGTQTFYCIEGNVGRKLNWKSKIKYWESLSQI